MNFDNGVDATADSTSRRRLMAGAVSVSALSLFPALAHAAADRISHTAESIHQEPLFTASRKRVYEALTDARQFGQVMQLSQAVRSGMDLGSKPVEISPRVGGTFVLYGGHIVGRQIELLAGERIVQAWRVVDWSPGVYSIAKFELTVEGSGTRIIFDHTGFPEGQAEHLAMGWTANYWEPLRKFLR